MLQSLRITNLAVVEALEIELDGGFTVLTGETGAGKSILVDAINLVLGARATAEWIRTGAEQATVEAVFDLDDETRAAAKALGVALEGEDEDELLVKRVIARNGKGRVFLNGGPATLGMLEALGRRLIDIAGQHEHQTLLEPAAHRAAVDAAAEAAAPLLARMREQFARLEAARREVEALAEKEADRARREDYLRFQVEELRTAAVEPGEEEALALERRRLAHAESLDDAITRAEDVLYAGEGAVSASIKTAIAQIAAAARIDPALAAHSATLESARLEIEEVARSLRDYRRAEPDPARLAEIEDRLALLDRLRKKHGAKDSTELAARQSALEADLAELTSLEEAIASRRAEEAAALAEAKKIAAELSAVRVKTGAALARQVARELAALGMSNAKFEVAVRRGTLGPMGEDEVEFLISPNPGEELKPLARTASGGELSRVMLALKCVVAKSHPVGTYVFDEVDAGIGGAIAERVGKRLESVARQQHQVLCITHLPQIAALADVHLRVTKSVSAGRTSTAVTRLDGATREEEISRMLGGVEITAATRAHAREMLAGERPGSNAGPRKGAKTAPREAVAPRIGK